MARRMCGSGCYGEHFAYFKPVHDAAPDIARTRTLNPTSTLLSAAMILGRFPLADAAERPEHAVEVVYAEGGADARPGRQSLDRAML